MSVRHVTAKQHRENVMRLDGRIDGLREALETMRSGVSRAEAERLIEERISGLMRLTR